VCYEALFNRETPCPWSVMDKIDEGGACFMQEYRLPRKGKIFQVRSIPIRLEDGSTVAIIGAGPLLNFMMITTTAIA